MDIKISGPNQTSNKHPNAKLETMWLAIREAQSSDSTIKDVPVRLYPEGYGAVLLTKPDQCDRLTCTGSTPSVNTSTRLVVFNWQRGTGLGVSGQS
jgi:hypothetical protein